MLNHGKILLTNREYKSLQAVRVREYFANNFSSSASNRALTNPLTYWLTQKRFPQDVSLSVVPLHLRSQIPLSPLYVKKKANMLCNTKYILSIIDIEKMHAFPSIFKTKKNIWIYHHTCVHVFMVCRLSDRNLHTLACI